MNKKTLISFIVIIIFLGGAYLLISELSDKGTKIETNQSPITSGENPEPGSTVHDLPIEPAALIARKDLATKLSIDEKKIVIINITDATWTDGCLGLGGPAESCLQALVSGFKIEMLAEGETYFYRTDKNGSVVRAETQ